MNWLNKNLTYIEEYNQDIYNAVYDLAVKNNCEFGDKFKIVETRDHNYTVEVACDELKTIRLNSVYNAEREAEKWEVKYKDLERVTSLIMFGCGNGIFYNHIKKKLDDYASIFIYEPNLELFCFCLANFDMEKVLNDKRVKVYIADINDRKIYEDLCRNVNWRMLATQIICFHPLYDKLFVGKYSRFKIITDEFKFNLQLSKNTSLQNGKKFTKNVLQNLQFIKESNYVGELVDKIENNIPIVIVSAGPSLDKNIIELKKAEGKAIILATDTSVQHLVKNNIKFDAIVTVDGNKPPEYLEYIECENKCMFVIPDANSVILKENNGRKIWLSGSGFLDILYHKYDLEFPSYYAGGSVATAAFWLAITLGMKKIILVGQDLAYDGKNTHAGRKIDIYEKKEEQSELYVDGIYSDKVRTRWDWFKYKQWFENTIRGLNDDIEIIDATEGGAKIEGTKIMKLSDAIDKICKKSINFEEDILKWMSPTFSDRIYRMLCGDIINILNEFAVIKECSKEGIIIANTIMEYINGRKLKDEKIDFQIEKICNIQNKIQEQNIYVLLDEYISNDVVDRIYLAAKKYDSEEQGLFENMKSNKILFEALMNAIEELTPIVKKVIKKL